MTPDSAPATLPNLTSHTPFDGGFIIKDEKTGLPLANKKYRIKRADDFYEYGITNKHGQTHIVGSTEAETLTLEVEGS